MIFKDVVTKSLILRESLSFRVGRDTVWVVRPMAMEIMKIAVLAVKMIGVFVITYDITWQHYFRKMTVMKPIFYVTEYLLPEEDLPSLILTAVSTISDHER